MSSSAASLPVDCLASATAGQGTGNALFANYSGAVLGGVLRQHDRFDGIDSLPVNSWTFFSSATNTYRNRLNQQAPDICSCSRHSLQRRMRPLVRKLTTRRTVFGSQRQAGWARCAYTSTSCLPITLLLHQLLKGPECLLHASIAGGTVRQDDGPGSSLAWLLGSITHPRLHIP